MMKIDERFTIIKQLGQGSFSKYWVGIILILGTIYSAEDKLRNEKVALKIEKPDKSKRILMFEYDVLKQL
jgi:serine/threonine protein kinase